MIKQKKENEEVILLKICNEENDSKKIYQNSNLLHSKKPNSNQFRITNNNTIASLKIIISDIENISSEKIHIFFIDKNEENDSKGNTNLNLLTLKKINRDFYNENKIYLEESRDIDYIRDLKIRLNINFYPDLFYIISDINSILYFDIHSYQICVIIDCYQQNIEKIIFNLESNCSILLLKNIIWNKLNYRKNLKISQIKLFCIEVTEYNEGKNSNTNIDNCDYTCPDWKKLNDIIEYFYPLEIEDRNGLKYNIHFLLTIVNEFKLYEQIGLNFRFNYLKEVDKISFNDNAPNYCMCSDGVNLFIFCINQECSLYNEYFVVILGYGLFNILQKAKTAKCPKCNSNKVELKNIGIINSKYYYKGILKVKNKKNAILEGDNITLDEKLYIFKEAKINSFLSELYMDVKPYFITPGKYSFTLRTKEDDKLDEIYLSDNAYSHKKTQLFKNFTHNGKVLKEFQNSNKIKIYDNESDLLDKNDIIIDGVDTGILDKVNCLQNVNLLNPCCFYSNGSNKDSNYEENFIEKSSFCCIF